MFVPYHSRQLEESGPPFPLGVLVCIGLSPPSVQEGEGERKGLSKPLLPRSGGTRPPSCFRFFARRRPLWQQQPLPEMEWKRGGRKTLPQILISRQSRNRSGGEGGGKEGHFSFPARLSVSDPQANDGERTVYLDAAAAAQRPSFAALRSLVFLSPAAFHRSPLLLPFLESSSGKEEEREREREEREMAVADLYSKVGRSGVASSPPLNPGAWEGEGEEKQNGIEFAYFGRLKKPFFFFHFYDLSFSPTFLLPLHLRDPFCESTFGRKLGG